LVVVAIIGASAQIKKKVKKTLNAYRRFEYSSDRGEQHMNKVQLPECGLFRKSAVLLATFLAIVFNVPAQVPSPAPVAADARDAQGNLVPGASATAERVIVTGSNIPTAEEVGPNPVDIYNRETMSKSGERTTEQFLQSLPTVNANVVPQSNNENGTNTAVGAATIALRGFDARATLILIDGRRVAPYPTGNNPGLVNVMFVDLNSIPAAAIDSIEILKDGASTTYGADAVAGVVNIKLRHDYQNYAETSVQYGNTEHEDSGEFIAQAIFGVGNDTTNVTGVLNYYHRNSIFQKDRAYSAVPPFLSSNNSPYNLVISSDVAAAAGGPNLNPGGTEFASPPDLTNGLAPASTYLYDTKRIRAAGGIRPGFNFNLTAMSYPESERYGGYLAADHKIFGDQMVLYADGYYENVKTHNEAAPPATGNFETKGQTTLAIPPNSPLGGVSPPNTPTFAETGVPADAFNPFNPFNQIISGSTRARLAEFGNRLFDNETDAVLTTVGVKGDKLFDGSWGYDSAFRYSQLKNVQTGQQVSASRFNRILNAADPIFDPTSPQFIGTTVPFNPFGDYRVPIASNQATVEFARVHPKDEDMSKIATVDGNIYTTSLVELPGGGVGFAVGAQFRRETLEETPDMLNVEGDIVGNSPVPPARGGRKSYSLYAEARVPIFGENFTFTGLHSLEFTYGVRFEEFLNNDTNVLVPKVGMRWQPLDDQLTIRSTWGEGYRQPSLEELYSAPISTLFGTRDPLNGGAFEPETNTLIESNKNLQPEDSRSFSAGFVYTPKYVPGLNISVDFWDTERTGIVASPTAQQVLDREATGSLLPGEVVERDPNTNAIDRIILANQNLGSQEARGYDFTVQYQKPTPWGTFTSLTQATYLDEFLFPQFNQNEFGAHPGNLAGRTTDTATSNEGWYKWKGTSQLDWNWNHFDAIFTARYIDGFHEFLGDAVTPHYVSQTWTFDVQASYDFTGLIPVENKPVPGYSKDAKDVARGKDGSIKETAAAQTANYGVSAWRHFLFDGTIITVGCNNITDRDPPVANGEDGNGQNYPGFTYDATNRFWYARLTKKF
jgi:iron complex outermembrane recepter protein